MTLDSALPHMPSSVIRYLGDCFVEDHRRSGILDIFGRGIEHRLVATGQEDILTGTLSRLPVDAEEAQPVSQAAQLYLRERELLYGSLFIVGRGIGTDDSDDADNRPERRGSTTICAPLLLYPARFIEDPPFVFVEPDLADQRINEGLIDAISAEAEGIDLAAAISEYAPPGELLFDHVAEIADLLERAVGHLTADDLRTYPALVGMSELRDARREAAKRNQVRAVPASAVLLVPRSRAVRGVATELGRMAKSDTYSAPVRMMLGHEPASVPGGPVTHVPGVLSAAQTRILESAVERPATLVIGPPGTGKSYTIAALALEHLGRGETVLISAKMDHAVNVIETKIAQDLGIPGCVMRGGRHAVRRRLAAYVRELLSGFHTAEVLAPSRIARDRRELDALQRKLNRLENEADRLADREIRWSRSMVSSGTSVGERIQARWSTWRARQSQPLWDLALEIDRVRETYVARARSHLRAVHQRRIADALRDHRAEIQRLDRALRARTSGRQAELFEQADLDVLLAAFPIWLVTTADIADILPLHREMFDLAIIDEATQCDVASALPILERARRAVVVGDPHQLRHISFLAMDRQRELAEKHSISEEHATAFDYRTHSLLDVVDGRVQTQDAVAFLDEHYRSTPPIIAFSNERFYAGRLRLMTGQPGQPARPAFVFKSCDGERDADGINQREVARVTDDILKMVAAERDLPAEQCHSLGVLSPFRSQIDALSERLAKELTPAELARHRLMVGTAHTFQGEERDVMFLSFALDKAAHPAALRFLERPDIFNVAITRARTCQYVYSSLDPGGLATDSLLRAYLMHIERHTNGNVTAMATPPRVPDLFAKEVAAALETLGFRTRTGYEIAGLTLDMVAYTREAACGIDLLGYPGHFEDAIPRERYRMLGRAGMPVVPVSYVRWCVDPDGCVETVASAIGQPGG